MCPKGCALATCPSPPLLPPRPLDPSLVFHPFSPTPSPPPLFPPSPSALTGSLVSSPWWACAQQPPAEWGEAQAQLVQALPSQALPCTTAPQACREPAAWAAVGG